MLKMVIVSVLVMAASCNDPRAVVTDIIHPDGSITRKIEIKNNENKLSVSNVQIPYDSSWSVKDSLEINEKGDTTWVRRAEKLFKSADELNNDYKADSSYNKGISRRIALTRKFRWFHTDFKFAEIIDKKMKYGYPASDFLNKEELTWFYSPEGVRDKEMTSSDSLKFKALNDSVNKKNESWFIRNFVSGWINEFANLYNEKAGTGVDIDSLKAREDELFKITVRYSDEKGGFDSLWNEGIIIKEFIGKANAVKYREEADSALNLVTETIFEDFRNYDVRIVMPGRVTGSNGFIDSVKALLWPVKSDYFLTQTYEMWAESKVPNSWAWIVSALFVLFVFAGIIMTRKGKG